MAPVLAGDYNLRGISITGCGTTGKPWQLWGIRRRGGSVILRRLKGETLKKTSTKKEANKKRAWVHLTKTVKTEKTIQRNRTASYRSCPPSLKGEKKRPVTRSGINWKEKHGKSLPVVVVEKNKQEPKGRRGTPAMPAEREKFLQNKTPTGVVREKSPFESEKKKPNCQTPEQESQKSPRGAKSCWKGGNSFWSEQKIG